jgi:hypothetical protein
MCRSPGGTAVIPDILAQQKGLQPVLGGLEIPDGVLPGATEVADGFVLDLRDIDRSPERISRASWVASRRSVLTRLPAFFGTDEGATT